MCVPPSLASISENFVKKKKAWGLYSLGYLSHLIKLAISDTVKTS